MFLKFIYIQYIVPCPKESIIYNTVRYDMCTLYRCRNCTVARYCDYYCEAKSWVSYHRYECGLIKYFNDVSSENYNNYTRESILEKVYYKKYTIESIL